MVTRQFWTVATVVPGTVSMFDSTAIDDALTPPPLPLTELRAIVYRPLPGSVCSHIDCGPGAAGTTVDRLFTDPDVRCPLPKYR